MSFYTFSSKTFIKNNILFLFLFFLFTDSKYNKIFNEEISLLDLYKSYFKKTNKKGLPYNIYLNYPKFKISDKKIIKINNVKNILQINNFKERLKSKLKIKFIYIKYKKLKLKKVFREEINSEILEFII